MNRWFTTADENAAPGGMTGLVGAFSLEFKYEIPEPVRPLTARFRRMSRRRKMDTML